jgi:tetratricopeptide (TPR) repeat protein
MNSESEGNNHRCALAIGALAIALLAFVVYLPILPGSFLLDDARLTGSDNPLVNGSLTLGSLWFGTDFALATFGWWVEHITFGSHPAGYHVVNVVLHALSAFLLWRLLAQLKIRGAWLAGALFVVHPVCVNSVARIGELKNTLCLPFLILSFISYLRYEVVTLYPGQSVSGGQRDFNKATAWYVVSLVAFVMALIARSTVAMLPVLLLFCALWQRGRITAKDILHTLPFFVLALAIGLLAIWSQKYQALPSTLLTLAPTTFPQRLAGAGYDFWFYLGKALFPFNLCMQYPRWTIDGGTVTAFLPDIFACMVFIFCLCFRRGWGRHVLLALGCFMVMLFPALGFFDAQFLTVWQVSDHLQYTALPAIVALVASGVAVLANKMVFRCVAAVLLLGASVLCFHRATVFSTPEDLYRDTVAKNPSASDSYNQLGIIMAKKGNYPEAINDFTLSAKGDPGNCDAWMDLGHTLTLQGKFTEAEHAYLTALKIRPNAAQVHKMYASLLQHQGRINDALYQLQLAAIFNSDATSYMDLASLEYATGNSRQAVESLRRALALQPYPPNIMILNNLAWILATCPDGSVRNGNDAVKCAELACRLTGYKQAGMMGTLAAAYAEAGRFPDAVTTAETAIKLATDAGNKQFAAMNQQFLLLYRAGKPFHEKRAGN